MARHLTSATVEKIIAVIERWPTRKKLSWEALRLEIRRRHRIEPARQTLARHAPIKRAFAARKDSLKCSPRTDTAPSVLRQQNERLHAENERLREENRRWHERFIVFQSNANKHGLTERDLATPLPRKPRMTSRAGHRKP